MNRGHCKGWAAVVVMAAAMAWAFTAVADAPKKNPTTDGGQSEPTPNPAGLAWISSEPAGVEFTKTEVTVGQYRTCVDAGVCSPFDRARREWDSCNWTHQDREDHPVNCLLSWKAAKSFCEWVGGRLPTEDEWYAEASDGGRRKYPWGDQAPTCERAVWSKGGHGCGRKSTWPVCSKPAGNSVSGLCDMAGNVWEWSTSHTVRVRGGAWITPNAKWLGASYQLQYPPANKVAYDGFRCARSLSLDKEESKTEPKVASAQQVAALAWTYSSHAGIEFTKSEVTVAQYRECTQAGSCALPAKDKKRDKRCNWGHADRDKHPVNCVDWHQAKAYCEWVGGRLPTNKEWFAEARAGENRKFAWGDEGADCDRAVMDKYPRGTKFGSRTKGRKMTSLGCGKNSTWSVCSKRPGNSVSGLCDLTGNVSEWMSETRQKLVSRKVRGGSWVDPAGRLRSGYNAMNFLPVTKSSYAVGFRCGRPSQ